MYSEDINQDFYSHIHNAPWSDIDQTLKLYAEAQTPAASRALADSNIIGATGAIGGHSLGNAVDFSKWIMEKALEIKDFENNNPDSIHSESHTVFCNWDLDADRGHAYKQWYTDKKPSNDPLDLDEKYLNENLSRD